MGIDPDRSHRMEDVPPAAPRRQTLEGRLIARALGLRQDLKRARDLVLARPLLPPIAG